jgi:hypothetical protein
MHRRALSMAMKNLTCSSLPCARSDAPFSLTGQAVFMQLAVSFPLTPALSLGERERLRSGVIYH